MDIYITLAELPIGESARIHSAEGGALGRERLLAFGLANGSMVKLLHGKAKGPRAVGVMETVVALRREELENIVVTRDMGDGYVR